MRRILIPLATASAALVALVLGGVPAQAATTTGPLFLSGGAIQTASATGAVTTLVKPTSGVHLGEPAYAPDHASFVYSAQTDGSTSGRLYRYDFAARTSKLLVTSAALEVVGGNSGYPVPIAWYAGGTKLAFVSWRGDTGATRLYTLNADGTGLSAVSTVSSAVAESIRSIAVTPNGAYIAYATDTAVSAVAPGSAPRSLSTGEGCGEVVAHPGTALGVSYLCNRFDASTSRSTAVVYNQDIGSAPVAFLTRPGSYASGGTRKAFLDLIWSHAGTRLLLQLTTTTTQSGSCSVTNTPAVVTVAASSRAVTTVYTGPVNHVTCEGDFPNLKSVAWSPDDSRIAFTDLTFTPTAQDLSTVASTGGTRTLVAHDASKLTW